MKRIVDGVTYNTDTSTKLARSEYEPSDSESVVATLYQTRGGAFFLDEEIRKQVWIESEREHEERVSHAFTPMSPEKAQSWIMNGETEIFRNPFEDPPEAEAEAEPGATIYIRVPAALKKGVDDAAKAENVSGNVWAMRCLERCLRNPHLQSAVGSRPEKLLIYMGTPSPEALKALAALGKFSPGNFNVCVLETQERAAIVQETIHANVKSGTNLLVARVDNIGYRGDRSFSDALEKLGV